MADTYLVPASWQGPSRELWPKAREFATRALNINPTAARAHLVLAGALLCHDLDQSAAEPVYLRALDLNPNDPLTRWRYAYRLTTEGRFDERLAEARQAVRLEPVSLGYNTGVARIAEPDISSTWSWSWTRSPPPLTPAKLRRNVSEDALDRVRVVFHAELVGDR